MKGLAVLSIVCVATVMLCPECFAAGPTIPGTHTSHSSDHSHSSASTNQFYVLVQRSGDDVSCSLYTTVDEFNKQVEVIVKQNAESTKTNKVVNAELRKLRGELTAKNKELAKAQDDDAKAEIQKSIETLKDQIAQKEAELKPVVKWVGPRRFNTREDAERFMEATYKEAEKIKEKKLEKKEEKKGDA